jgi:hypothetical protein
MAKVVDLFGDTYKEDPKIGAPPNDEAKKAKDDKAEHIIDRYCTHLEAIINWGSYSECLELAEIIKMGEIKLCINTLSTLRL